MRKYRLKFSSDFRRELKKLSVENRNLVFKKAKILRQNPFYPSLRSKKLKSKPGLFECSVTMSIRIIWRYEDDKIILMLDVGHHDILNNY